VTSPAYRAFHVEVARTSRLGASLVRLTFSGADLAGFGYGGADQRVKVLLAATGRALEDDLPTGDGWYQQWRALPDEIRPTMRTYTVRAFRPEAAELDVDVVLHGGPGDESAGPVSTWAAGAVVGDRAALLGPDRPGTGRLWGVEWAPPQTARRLVLAGDETALPAIAAILEQLPFDAAADVLVEVPEEGDRISIAAPEQTRLRWLVRHTDRHREPGELLVPALRELFADATSSTTTAAAVDTTDDDELLWDVPDEADAGQEVYVWLAGEAGAMRSLRRIARIEAGLPRESVACMGYWRKGRPEAT
jgi:NADPH-dependent ferric siderophore reductase